MPWYCHSSCNNFFYYLFFFLKVLSLNITVQTDGIPIANIRVNNQQAAQFIISQLHRQKLGHKRIVISYAQSNSPDPEQLRAMVVSILQVSTRISFYNWLCNEFHQILSHY